MNTIQIAITFLALSLILIILLERVFIRYDVGFYRLFQEKQRAFFMFTAWSIMYLFYVLSFGYQYIPLVIIFMLLCFGWVYMFFMDTSLDFVETKDKILLLSITAIALIGFYSGFKYLMLLGINKSLRNRLVDSLRISEMKLIEAYIEPDDQFDYTVHLVYNRSDYNSRHYHNIVNICIKMLESHLKQSNIDFTKVMFMGGTERNVKENSTTLGHEYFMYFNRTNKPLCEMAWYDTGDCNNLSTSLISVNKQAVRSCDDCRKRRLFKENLKGSEITL